MIAARSALATLCRSVVMLAGVLTTGAACAGRTRASLAPSAVRVDTVWYASARARVDGRDSRELSDTLEYGYVIYESTPPADALGGALHVSLVDSVQLSADAFVGALRTLARSDTTPDATTVLYVHGFGTSLREGWQYTAEARIRSRSSARWIVFCWPSNGLGITWPRFGELLTRAYHHDTQVATASRPAFVRSAQTVISAVGASRLVLLSHSLGGRIVSDALTADFGLASVAGSAHLQAIAFVAPDVDAQQFGDSVVPSARRVARRVVLYTSGRDRVLSMARQVNDADRAGQPNATPLVRPGLETVDMTDGFVAEGWFQGIFGTHHAIRRASAALFDLLHIVGAGIAPGCRTLLKTAQHTDAGVWRLGADRPPMPAATHACEHD